MLSFLWSFFLLSLSVSLKYIFVGREGEFFPQKEKDDDDDVSFMRAARHTAAVSAAVREGLLRGGRGGGSAVASSACGSVGTFLQKAGMPRVLTRDFSTSTTEDETNRERRKRVIHKMLYRAKQRGFLELDVVVGEWAERNLNAKTTSDSFLTQFAKVLEEENPDLYSYLTGQSEAPKYLREENEAYKALKAHVMKFLDEKSDEKTRAKFGKEWVRGWNDGSSEGGNQ